ncbi:serine protease [Gymnodinialimonas sp. 2305UL16-5]|uniref:serine protease n=1 Tax=Gymnodinialimonas mytili TaxID=3126503 RepID=UPI00309BAF33
MLTHFFRGLLALTIAMALAVMTLGPAQAQDRVWVQIEAHPDLATAETRVRAYAQLVDNVNGFQAVTGLYAVALGPYEPALGQQILLDLRGQGLIPRDSFLENGDLYATQFFPVGTNTLQSGVVVGTGDVAEADATQPTPVSTETEAEPEPAPAPVALPEETRQEALASERLLTREQRDELQIAMQWFGFYNSLIDGDFGPGTRNAMEAWQIDRGVVEITGILTTRQRAQLLEEYYGELNALGMAPYRDERAGIEIDLPLAMVEFDAYNFPFAQFAETNDSGVRVMLISQPGDRTTLFGLYEIMQTLDIVPLDGERARQGDSFLLTGQSATLRSHTEARLVGGAVKGFTLIWEPEVDDQIARVLPMMQSSFSAFAGTLDPASVPEGLDESIDMVSGLTVRSPDLVRTGFFVDSQGSVLTTTEVVAGQCDRILVDEAYPATITFRDDALGVAVLSPQQALAPISFARFAAQPGRLRSDVAVAGYPFGGALSSASTSFGTLEDLQGMNGEEVMQRLAVNTADSEAGGPVLDARGNVIGVVLPGQVSGRSLPSDVTMALRGDQLLPVLEAAGVTLNIADASTAMNREVLSRAAADITVRVSCWN